MSDITKPEQYANELAIFQLRYEQGLQAMREWLYRRRDQINREWPGIDQDLHTLTRLQGEARAVAKLIRLIDIGPAVKPIGGVNHGN